MSLCLVPLGDIWDVPKRTGEQADGVRVQCDVSLDCEVEQVVRVIQRKKGGARCHWSPGRSHFSPSW